jgi:hypothetical protein
MGVNGVSHHIVRDDLEGVLCVLRWLAFTPVRIGDAPPLLPTADPLTRGIGYLPREGAWVGGWVGGVGWGGVGHGELEVHGE